MFLLFSILNAHWWPSFPNPQPLHTTPLHHSTPTYVSPLLTPFLIITSHRSPNPSSDHSHLPQSPTFVQSIHCNWIDWPSLWRSNLFKKYCRIISPAQQNLYRVPKSYMCFLIILAPFSHLSSHHSPSPLLLTLTTSSQHSPSPLRSNSPLRSHSPLLTPFPIITSHHSL